MYKYTFLVDYIQELCISTDYLAIDEMEKEILMVVTVKPSNSSICCLNLLSWTHQHGLLNPDLIIYVDWIL